MSEHTSLWLVLIAVIAVLAVLGLLTLAGNKWLRRRGVRRTRDTRATPSRAARPSAPLVKRRVQTRHPVVLAHGWGGIDSPICAQLGYSYFRGIPQALRDCGHRVHVVRVSPTGGIELRAKQLARQVARLDTRVNIVAHSMGGLDARLAIARYGLDQHVASLTTIGTPHHGTPLADLAQVLGDWQRARLLLRRLGLSVDGVYDLTTTSMRSFNDKITDAPNVQYNSVVAAAEPATVHALLCWGHRYMDKIAGHNDGVVPQQSQRWGDTLEEIGADHWAQIGWSSAFDAHSFYNRILRRLSARDL